MDQRFLAADLYADEAVGAMGFDGELFGVDDVDDLDVVLMEGEAGEVAGIGVDEVLGDGVKFGLSLRGLRIQVGPV